MTVTNQEKVASDSKTQAAREKWNRIYAGEEKGSAPATAVTESLAFLPAQGSALDIACGRGTNALYLAEQGLDVDAWDISDVVVDQLQDKARSLGLSLTARCCDIQPDCFAGRQWDVIVNCHYLDRSLTAAMKTALAPGGLILFQTFTAAKRLDTGPSNPDFLLAPGELESIFSDFDVLTARDESLSTDPANPLAGRALIIARKPT